MDIQFEDQFSSFMHSVFSSLELSSHLSSEEDIIKYISNIIKKHSIIMSPKLQKSVKDPDYAKRILSMRDISKMRDHKRALGILNDIIRHVTTTHDFVELLMLRVLLLVFLDYYYEVRADLRLISALVEDVPRSISELRKLFDKDSSDNERQYEEIVKHFPPIKSHEIKEILSDKIESIYELSKQSSVPEDKTFHNPPRNCVSPPVTEPWISNENELSQSRATQQPVTEACVSRALRIETSDDRGRHVVALRDIAIGEVIISEEAHVKCLLNNRRGTHCVLCFSPCLAPLPCGSCPDVVFCSEACMKADKSHNVECGYVSHLSSLPKMVYLAVKTITTSPFTIQNYHDVINGVIRKYSDVIKSSNTIKETPSTAFTNTINLSTNFKLRAPCDILRRTCRAIFLTNFLKSIKIFEKLSDQNEPYYTTSTVIILKTLQSYPCNAHEISEFQYEAKNLRFSMNEDVGAGAFPFLSLINHSCDPNVVRHSHGTRNIVRALRSIKKGDEIVDNYGYHYATHIKKERTKALKSQYYFTCSCDCCKGAWPLFPEIPNTVVLKCKMCQKPLINKIKCCMTKYNKVLEQSGDLIERAKINVMRFVSGDVTSVTESSFSELLTFVDNYMVRPYRLYNECQEALKQFYNLSSNRIST